MPKLIIDDREIEVAAGTKVIEAAARLGIMIPRSCYHPALGSVAACRMCAVKVLEDDQDEDNDGDGIQDQDEQDEDGDGNPDDSDEDDDNDGIPDYQDTQ